MTTPHAEMNPKRHPRRAMGGWPRRFAARVSVALLMALLLSPALPTAWAQAELPTELVSATRLTGDQEQAVRAYAAQHAQGLGSSDPELRRRARGRLLEPLSSSGTSVSFRLAYSGALVPELDRMHRSGEIEVRLNAVRVAGELATQDASDLVVRALESNSVEMRIMAAFALRRTFETLSTQAPAMAENRVRELLNRLGAVLENEADPLVFDASVRAMTAAGGIARPNFNLRNEAYRMLAERVGTRVRARSNAGDTIGVLRTGEALIEALRSTEPLEARAAVAAGGFAGDALALVRDRLHAGVENSGEERAALESLAQIAEAVVFFALTIADPGQSPNPTGHAAALREGGGVERFVAGVERDLLGPNAVLTRRPFNFAAERFQSR